MNHTSTDATSMAGAVLSQLLQKANERSQPVTSAQQQPNPNAAETVVSAQPVAAAKQSQASEPSAPPSERPSSLQITPDVEQAVRLMDRLANQASQGAEIAEGACQRVAELLIDAAMDQPAGVRLYCQQRAARIVKELAAGGLSHQLIICISLCLSRRLDLIDVARIDLLNALITSAERLTNDEMEAEIARDTGQIVLQSVQLEAIRPACFQSLCYFSELASCAQRFPHKGTWEVLKLIGTCHADPHIRKLANDSYQIVRQSLKVIWSETRKDLITDLESRAARLASRGSSMPPAALVQLIFNTTKSVPIETIFDPRVTHLKSLLKSDDSTVRMACCWALLGQGHFNRALDSYLDTTLILTDIAVNSQSHGLARDALDIMRRLQTRFTESHDRLEKGVQKASLEFVRQRENLLPETKCGDGGNAAPNSQSVTASSEKALKSVG